MILKGTYHYDAVRPLLHSLKNVYVRCVLQITKYIYAQWEKSHTQGWLVMQNILPSAFSTVHCSNHISLLLVNDVVHLTLRGDGVLSLSEELITIHYVLKFFVINTYALNVGALGA